MSDSCIPGLNKDAIRFVYNNLMIDQSDDDAAKALTKLTIVLSIFQSESKGLLFLHQQNDLRQPQQRFSEQVELRFPCDRPAVRFKHQQCLLVRD
jgi:hypothetical protein